MFETNPTAGLRSDPHKVMAARLGQLYRHRGLGLLVNLGNGAIAAGVAQQVLPRLWVAGWFAVLLLLTLLQFLYAGRQSRHQGRVLARRWPYLLITAGVGLVWGLGALALPLIDEPLLRLVLLLVLCVAMVGVLPLYVSLPAAWAVYLWLAVLPWLAVLLWSGGEAQRIMAVVLALFVLNLMITGRAMSTALTENLRRQSGYELLAHVDGLTGIPNRRAFDQALPNEWNRAARSRVPLSLILIDVDYFKKYNDFYGHPEGDDCLRQVADTLAGRVRRAGDILARYGGEEFVLLLYHMTRDDAVALAEQLRRAIESLNLPHEPSGLGRVTISLGGATVVPGEAGSAAALLDAADEALYRAKAQGRNRAEWASTLRG